MQKDDVRIWIDMGDGIEASYDGIKYVDFRSKSAPVHTMFFSRELLVKALTMFPVKNAEVR